MCFIVRPSSVAESYIKTNFYGHHQKCWIYIRFTGHPAATVQLWNVSWPSLIKKIAVPVRNRRPRTACNRMSAPFKPADARSFHTVSLEQRWNMFPNYGRQCVCPDLQDFRTKLVLKKTQNLTKLSTKCCPKTCRQLPRSIKIYQTLPPFFPNVGQIHRAMLAKCW